MRKASLTGKTLFCSITLAASVSVADSNAPSEKAMLFEPGLVSTGFDESHVAFAPDGSALYFLRNTPDFSHWTIMQSSNVGGRWGRPTVAPFSGTWSDADVFITHDGERLFFVSNRPVDGHAKEDTDIWMMRRASGGRGAPVHVPELSSTGYEWFPTLTDSGTIYFGSEREGGAGASDLWRAKWLGDRFSAPENLGPIFNTANQEIEPLIARDERWLIFAARGRTPSAGSYDLYISFNCPSGWSAPAPLGADVNSAGWDFAPRMSLNGQGFFFTSNRSTM